jgi:hypothetical protein
MFTLTIDTTNAAFGETEHQKRTKICSLLHEVIGVLGSGRDPGPLVVRSAGREPEVVGKYTFDVQDELPRVPRQAIDQGAVDKIHDRAAQNIAKAHADAQKKRDALSGRWRSIRIRNIDFHNCSPGKKLKDDERFEKHYQQISS